LKKRTKKLLLLRGIIGVPAVNETPDADCKSFLVLFFKKERLPSLGAGPACNAYGQTISFSCC
jgi:hypothetical protein